jgi:hypothetical protein
MRPKLYYEYSTDTNNLWWHGECPSCGEYIGVVLETQAPATFDTTTLKLICPKCHERFEFDKVYRYRKGKYARIYEE